MAAAGDRVQQELITDGVQLTEPHIFPGSPILKPNIEYVDLIKEMLKRSNVTPIAVGSGTINDLTKLAAAQAGRPYMVVATAASMDGYTSYGASIMHAGAKITDPCDAPKGVLADLDVISHAPGWLAAAGYGDLLGKVTAGADWILADALEIDPILPDAWSIVQDDLHIWTENPQGVMDRDHEVLTGLLEGLIFSGLAIQVAQSTRPASGSEHLFSHLWQMTGVEYQGERAPHGFTVGLGSIASSTIYDELLAQDLSDLDTESCVQNWQSLDALMEEISEIFIEDGIQRRSEAQTREKYIDTDELRARLVALKNNWPEIHVRLAKQVLSAQDLKQKLREAGCPTSPSDFGIATDRFLKSYSHARFIRSRYTILDTIHEIGMGDKFVGQVAQNIP